jgi:tRNA pseudouridine55 synthase
MHGVLVVDKPAGLTSADVVARVKRALRAEKVGHTGTLDPMATGVLPLVVGEATKLAPFLLADDKGYDGELELGVITDSLDAEGTVLERRAWQTVDEASLRGALSALMGETLQVPPMHSALRHEGRRLYELARRGQEVERPARPITVHRFELLGWERPRARFHVDCSKGTYVRSLVRDVGERLGCGATLTALRRTRAGSFTLEQALPLEDLPARAASALVSLGDALRHLPAFRLDEAQTLAALQGRPLTDPALGDTVRLLDRDGRLVAVAQARNGALAYLRVFRPC